MLRRGTVEEVEVEGLSVPAYIKSKYTPLLERIDEVDHCPKRSFILAPLDNVLWDRKLIQDIFSFHYVWEVYKPPCERMYGYYVLPVLHGEQFVARFEPGMDRKSGTFTIKNWWWEQGVECSEGMAQSLCDCFAQFLGFLGAKQVCLDAVVAKIRNLDWLRQLSC